MKTRLLVAAVIFASCSKEIKLTSLPNPSPEASLIAAKISTVKKGVGLSESKGYGNKQLDSLKVSWYYNWGVSTTATSKAFTPICFSLNTIKKLYATNTLLGFNEPDNSSQSNMSVATALTNWKYLVAKSTRLGSPASAGNPLTAGSWLSQFMAGKPKVDFICVHWYKGTDYAKFISDMKAIIALYKLPIWVTEFAPQTVSSSTASPTKYTQAQVNTFIKNVVAWMETEPMVEKYAWHDSQTGTSALYTTTGGLSSTGIAYRDAQ